MQIYYPERDIDPFVRALSPDPQPEDLLLGSISNTAALKKVRFQVMSFRMTHLTHSSKNLIVIIMPDHSMILYVGRHQEHIVLCI